MKFLDWKVALGLAISAAGLYYVFHDQDPAALLHEVRSAKPVPFTIATVLATVVFWIRAWRWKALLEPVRADTSFRSRFAATTIRFMGNNIFPLRAGEVLGPLALARAEKLPVIASMTSIVLERVLDTLTIVGLLFLSMYLPGLPSLAGSDAFTDSGRSIGVMVLVGLAVLIALVTWPSYALRLTGRVTNWLPPRISLWIRHAAESFLTAAGALRQRHLVARAVGWSLVLWLVNALGFWYAMRAFDLNYSFTAALFFQGVLGVAVALPSAPGFFGLYEAAAALVLVEMWGADLTTTNAFAAAYHIAGFIPVTVIGLYYAKALGVSAKSAAPAAQENVATVGVGEERTP